MSLRLIILAGAWSLGAGCADAPDGTSAQPLPLTSGSYVGRYAVPMSPALTVAGTFDVPRVDWTVNAGIARLDYDLPEGLVGGKLSIEFSGALESGETAVVLTSEHGTASCTMTGSLVSCSEQLVALGSLPLSTAVIEQRATVEYAGPVADRLAVAQVFGSDPIGIVTFDVSRAARSGQ